MMIEQVKVFKVLVSKIKKKNQVAFKVIICNIDKKSLKF